ncbi:hypothetical protein [Nonomuraea zeae]|uniref:DUF4386 family protein n=1 Tax=Nonomuraea zeae TaxID=1642303 RepID=A0A5S4H195_9ACTN|nr:hypothetical protein [Nonomuraea zeae]TMR39008.1 hypothetical protein ETD85_02700 [Nonomuraea zeae]
MTDLNPRARLAGALLLSSALAMIAGAAMVVPSGLTLNPADPAATLAAVDQHAGLHLAELAVDVLGWLALTAAGLVVAAGSAEAPRPYLVVLAGGLLSAAGLAGLAHDAGNLALTQLAHLAAPPQLAQPGRPGQLDQASAVAAGVLLTAKWLVNLAGLLWVAATAAAAAGVPMPGSLRRAGVIVAIFGLAGVALPWTTGGEGPSVVMEQAGYALHLPVLLWYGVLGGRFVRGR